MVCLSFCWVGLLFVLLLLCYGVVGESLILFFGSVLCCMFVLYFVLVVVFCELLFFLCFCLFLF